MKKERHLIRRGLRALGAAVLTLLLAGIFYVAVILGQPQPDDAVQVDLHQPLLQASAAQEITSEEGLTLLLQSFPVPVLSCVPGSGCRLTYGRSYDMAYEGGFARILELTYVSPQGVQFRACSIYPARALALMGKDDYTLSAQEGPLVAGMRTVRMERGNSIRLHAQSENGLYYVTLDGGAGALADTLRPLQLLTAEGR